MITIEKPTKEGVRQIQEVFYKTWLATYPNKEAGITIEDIEEYFKNRFTKEKIKEREERTVNPLEGSIFLVAKDGPKVIGVCVPIKKAEFNQLRAIYVLPEYQGHGIGKMLWQEAIKFFDKDKDIIVQVATYNENAINFYKKLGFIDTGRRFSDEGHRMPISKSLIPEMEMIIKNRYIQI